VRVFNVEEAASCDEEELKANLVYLEYRCRWQDIGRIEQLRAAAKPKKSKAAKEEE